MQIVYRPLPLKLGLHNWTLYATRNHDTHFHSFRDTVFERDENTCQYCGFSAQTGMTILNLDGNYHNNQLSNLVTTCPICAQCQFLETVGQVGQGDGVLIHCPDLSQNELNGLCHVLFCAMTYSQSYKQQSESIYQTFKLRSKLVEKRLGANCSQPKHFSQMLIDTPLKERDAVSISAVQDMRLLPLFESFKDHISQWGHGAIDRLAGR